MMVYTVAFLAVTMKMIMSSIIIIIVTHRETGDRNK